MRPPTAASSARIVLTLAALGLVHGLARAPSAAAERPPADRVTLVGLEGGELTEADLEHGLTVLVVWASWSPRCRDVAARIAALAASWAPRARVASVVFQEEPAAVRQFLDGKSREGDDPGVPVFIDVSGSFSKKHAVTTLPWLLVFDAGRTAFRGKLPADPDPVIERALAADAGR